MLAHHVYFTLKDRSRAAAQGLVAACHKFLTGHEGVVFYAAGLRGEEFTRGVNDVAFDVALLVIFRDKAAHDAYQVAERHNEFVAEQAPGWERVQVFDAYVEQGG